jgi:hypothetical protein
LVKSPRLLPGRLVRSLKPNSGPQGNPPLSTAFLFSFARFFSQLRSILQIADLFDADRN